MENTTYIIALVAYLGLATALLYRSPTHGWGFPMFILLYPIFLVAFFFAAAQFVILVWLALALLNMAVQSTYMKSSGVQKGLAGVMVASLFLWPVQFAAAINGSQTEKDERENKETNRQKIGELPATIKGTVSYAHHLGTEEGHDSVWLEEFGDLSFITDAKTFDRIGIAEGKVVSLTVDEREAPVELEVGKVLWITDGKSQDDKATA